MTSARTKLLATILVAVCSLALPIAAHASTGWTADDSFGFHGNVPLPAGVTVERLIPTLNRDGWWALGTRTSGSSKIPVVGKIRTWGIIDPTFGAGTGWVDLPHTDGVASDLAETSGGDIIVVWHGTYDGMQTIRLKHDGTLRTSWGTNGVSTVATTGGDAYGIRVSISSGGSVYVAGFRAPIVGQGARHHYVLIGRLDSTTGALDETYATGGLYQDTADVLSSAYQQISPALTFLNVAADSTITYGVDEFTMRVTRITSSAVPDATFGASGVIDQTWSGLDETADGVHVDGTGAFDFVREHTDWSSGDEVFDGLVVQRFTAAGAPDPSFGSSGSLTLSLRTTLAADGIWATGSAHAADGSILVSGTRVDADDNELGGFTAWVTSAGTIKDEVGIHGLAVLPSGAGSGLIDPFLTGTPGTAHVVGVRDGMVQAASETPLAQLPAIPTPTTIPNVDRTPVVFIPTIKVPLPILGLPTVVLRAAKTLKLTTKISFTAACPATAQGACQVTFKLTAPRDRRHAPHPLGTCAAKIAAGHSSTVVCAIKPAGVKYLKAMAHPAVTVDATSTDSAGSKASSSLERALTFPRSKH